MSFLLSCFLSLGLPNSHIAYIYLEENINKTLKLSLWTLETIAFGQSVILGSIKKIQFRLVHSLNFMASDNTKRLISPFIHPSRDIRC